MTGWHDIVIPDELIVDDARFADAFGSIYEHSPWIAERARTAGGSAPRSFGDMAARMRVAVDAAPREEQLALLLAHPELASRAALAGELTADSGKEQKGAGLDRCSPEELTTIQTLNARYNVRFGFPFIIAVAGLTRSDILDAFAARCEGERESEFAEAIAQVHRIAAVRLGALAATSRTVP